MGDGASQVEICEGDEGKQTKVEAAALIVEIVAEERDKEDAGRVAVLIEAQQPINEGEAEEKPQEDARRENHRGFGVVCQ